MKRLMVLSLITVNLLFAQDPVTWTKHIISDEIEKAKKNEIADINQDGYLDIVCTANPEGSAGTEDEAKPNVLLYLNDGSQNFNQYIISYRFRGARGLAIGDLNGDGYPDVAVGNRDYDSSLVWFENPVDRFDTEWTVHHLGTGAPLNYIVKITDLNQDGFLDIVDGTGDTADNGSLDGDYIRWFENDGQLPPHFTEHDIINYPSPSGIAVADFDGDLDTDLSGCCWLNYVNPQPVSGEDVRWWSQDVSSAWSQQEIIQDNYGGNDLYAADMDADGDADILGAGWKSQTINWWANDGTGNFSGSGHLVTSGIMYPRNVVATDMDGDGDKDILSCADNDNSVFWFENDGLQNFNQHFVTTDFTYAYFVSAKDMDGDGDRDIIGTAQNKVEAGDTIEGQIAWWENNLAEEKNIVAGDPDTVHFSHDQIVIDFSDGFSGGNTSVFFNHGENEHIETHSDSIRQVVSNGFYTIVTQSMNYDAELEFHYDSVPEWTDLQDRNDLRICYWDDQKGKNGQWTVLNPWQQESHPDEHYILVRGVNSALHKFSLFTLGWIVPDSTFSVDLLSFSANISQSTIILDWETASEKNNLGFELYRKDLPDTTLKLISSYLTNDSLIGQGTPVYGKNYSFTDDQVNAGTTYEYWLYGVRLDSSPVFLDSTQIHFVPDNIVSKEKNLIPQKLTLKNNYPNPFNQSTVIKLQIPAGGNRTFLVDIFDINGRLIRHLFKGFLKQGEYHLFWDGANDAGKAVASGMYICRASSQNNISILRMTLVR